MSYFKLLRNLVLIPKKNKRKSPSTGCRSALQQIQLFIRLISMFLFLPGNTVVFCQDACVGMVMCNNTNVNIIAKILPKYRSLQGNTPTIEHR